MNNGQGWKVLICCLLALHCVLLGCAVYIYWHQSRVSSATMPATPISAVRETLFQRTINDAALINPSRVVNTLFALNTDNPKLEWSDTEPKMIKVVAWMSEAAFTRHYFDQDTNTLVTPITAPPENIASIWVTLSPQVKEFCQQLDYEDPTFRLKQYLGLDPNRSYTTFVEFWVSPDDIFRPCTDPSPADQSCNLTFSEEDPVVAGIADYRRFYHRLQQSSYSSTGAPWTRLGYTYDWHYGLPGVGASEYIIAPGAQLYPFNHYSTQDYCQ